MGSARHGQTETSDGLERRTTSGLSGDVVNEHVTGVNSRQKPTLPIVNLCTFLCAAQFIRPARFPYNPHRRVPLE